MRTVLSEEALKKGEFLERIEKQLRGGLYQQALSSAREMLALIPGDVDLRIIIGRALVGLGEINEASTILEDIEADILRWKSMLEKTKVSCSSGTPAKMQASANAFQNRYEESLRVADREEIDSESAPQLDEIPGAPNLLTEFKTVTMAELYIQQGHFDLAREVLDGILDREPADTSARLKLKRLDLIQAARYSLSEEKRLFVLHELEGWLSRIRSSQGGSRL